jgi:hypothetical protein
MKFDIEFREVIQVNFLEPEKTEKYFITEDPTNWRKSFYQPVDLQDLSELIGRAFKFESEYFDKERKGFTKFLEGFGEFNRQAGGDISENVFEVDQMGKIQIEITDEEDVEFVTEAG